MSVTIVPKLELSGSIWDGYPIVGKPGWFPRIDRDGNTAKPLIRCNCGSVSGIGLHHVHADGTVTASFFHSEGTNAAIGEDPDGCGWHVWLKLADWTGEDIGPDVRKTP